jgi:hypothetical protein
MTNAPTCDESARSRPRLHESSAHARRGQLLRRVIQATRRKPTCRSCRSPVLSPGYLLTAVTRWKGSPPQTISLYSLISAFPSGSAGATDRLIVTIDTVASGRPIFSQHFICCDSGRKHRSCIRDRNVGSANVATAIPIAAASSAKSETCRTEACMRWVYGHGQTLQVAQGRRRRTARNTSSHWHCSCRGIAKDSVYFPLTSLKINFCRVTALMLCPSAV